LAILELLGVDDARIDGVQLDETRESISYSPCNADSLPEARTEASVARVSWLSAVLPPIDHRHLVGAAAVPRCTSRRRSRLHRDEARRTDQVLLPEPPPVHLRVCRLRSPK